MESQPQNPEFRNNPENFHTGSATLNLLITSPFFPAQKVLLNITCLKAMPNEIFLSVIYL